MLFYRAIIIILFFNEKLHVPARITRNTRYTCLHVLALTSRFRVKYYYCSFYMHLYGRHQLSIINANSQIKRLRTEYARDLFTHYYYADPFEIADCA